ncbi:MAG: low molecular weight phosphatase family protein [Pseudomonadota bacterium]
MNLRDPDPPDAAGSESKDLPGSVLFACSLNAVRSPMAASILQHLAGSRVYVASGGVRAGEVDPFAICAMDEIGIDLSKHQPHTLEDLHDTSFDLVISLSPEAHHHAIELTRTMAVDVEYWPTGDATVRNNSGNREDILNRYREVRDQLFQRIKRKFSLTSTPSV